MSSRKDSRPAREVVAEGGFWLRIVMYAQRGIPARTEVTAYSWKGRNQTLRFYDGPIREELKPAAQALSKALAEFAGRPWSPEEHDPPKPERLRSFQNAAVSLFGRIFRYKSEKGDAKRQKTVRGDLDFYLGHPNLDFITFDSDLPGIPLDALHYGRDGAPFDADGFIGCRAPVLHGPRPDKDPRVDPGEPLTVSLLGARKLNSVGLAGGASIHSVFEKLIGVDPARVATPLKGIDGEDLDPADLPALFRTLGKLRSVWHLTSHMGAEAEQPFFVLDNKLEVRPGSLDLSLDEARAFLGEPLVFLNICSSAAGGVIADANFPDALHLMEAGGVIATHCEVYERFATEFARRFYNLALSPAVGPSGERLRVGESLLRARRESIEHDETLASLCYSFHTIDDFWLPEAPHAEPAAVLEGTAHGAA